MAGTERQLLTFDWFLPTSGDGRTIVGRGHSLPVAAAGTQRPPDIEYLAQVARSAEHLGFAAVLTPTGTWCEDAWLTTAALIAQTSRSARTAQTRSLGVAGGSAQARGGRLGVASRS